jgi:hypothetical protein
MLKVSINGKVTHVPQCTCGKCIVRLKLAQLEPSVPYHNIRSIYTSDYPPKKAQKDPGFYNRSKHNGFENTYTGNIPDLYKTIMKQDYTPNDMCIEKIDKTTGPTLKPPFTGQTRYQYEYPNWGSGMPNPKKPKNYPNINIPLRGQTNYKENYIPYPNNQVRVPLKRDGQLTNNIGPLDGETTYGTDYVPKIGQNYDLGDDPNKIPIAFLTAEFPPGAFDTTYRDHYINYDDNMCRLRKYLNARGMRYLVI